MSLSDRIRFTFINHVKTQLISLFFSLIYLSA